LHFDHSDKVALRQKLHLGFTNLILEVELWVTWGKKSWEFIQNPATLAESPDSAPSARSSTLNLLLFTHPSVMDNTFGRPELASQRPSGQPTTQ
nr:hypothetical protein [Actinomycetota bacterium]